MVSDFWACDHENQTVITRKSDITTGVSVLDSLFVEALQALIRSRVMVRDGRGRAVREQAGLSLRDVAQAVGVDAATLSRWETGRSMPRRAAAARWVEACNAIERELGSNSAPEVGNG
jgi:DNA-binding transcriptional regulator YiaG